MGSIEESENSLMVEEIGVNSIQIDPQRDRFPYCIVWSPLPLLSWFIPFIGHIGICRENGVILDFAGPNFVCVDNFTFGRPTRYIQLSKEQCCIFFNSSSPNENKDESKKNEARGDEWDGVLHKSTQEYQHQAYNILTCNCHSFVANCLNRLKFETGGWNVVTLAILIFLKGKWVSNVAIVRSFLPFLVVFGLGFFFGGWSFFTYWAIVMFVLVGWFVVGTYCFKKLIHL